MATGRSDKKPTEWWVVSEDLDATGFPKVEPARSRLHAINLARVAADANPGKAFTVMNGPVPMSYPCADVAQVVHQPGDARRVIWL